MNLNDANRWLWLWLLQHGGAWTAADIAQRTGYSSTNIFRALHDMARRLLVEQLEPEPGHRRKRYAVTPECLVPLGMRVGEVRDPARWIAPPPPPGGMQQRRRGIVEITA